jgi:hypothetical protein
MRNVRIIKFFGTRELALRGEGVKIIKILDRYLIS